MNSRTKPSSFFDRGMPQPAMVSVLDARRELFTRFDAPAQIHIASLYIGERDMELQSMGCRPIFVVSDDDLREDDYPHDQNALIDHGARLTGGGHALQGWLIR